MASPSTPYETMIAELNEAIADAAGADQSDPSVRAALGRLHKVRQEIRTGGLNAGAPHDVRRTRDKIATIAALHTEEVQSVSDAGGDAGSKFTLTFDGQTTAELDADTATSAQVKSALEALSNIAPGDVKVTGSAGGPFKITFLEDGAYGDTNVPAITGTGVDVNEVQTLSTTGSPSAGDFTLTYSGQTTAAIAYNANAAAVDTALENLSNIPAGGVTCTGGALPGTPVTITFTGDLAGTNVPLLTVTDNVTGGDAVITQGTQGKNGATITVTTNVQGGS